MELISDMEWQMELIGLSVLSPFALNEMQADVKRREKNVNGANAYSLMTCQLPTQSRNPYGRAHSRSV